MTPVVTDMRTMRRIFGEAKKALNSGELRSAGELIKQLLIACGDQRDGFYADVLYHAGVITSGLGEHHWATVILDDVVKMMPTHFYAYYNLGVCHLRIGHLDQAKSALDMANTLRPHNLLTVVNLSNHAMAIGDADEAIRLLHLAGTLDPTGPDQDWVKATALLALGEWQQGWASWEKRWAHPAFLAQNRRAFFASHTRWSGETIGRRTLLIHPEQGMGDSIQFARHLGRLRAEHPDAHLILETHAPLVALFRRSFAGVVNDVRTHAAESLPPFDLFVGLGSLASIYGDDGSPVRGYLRPAAGPPAPEGRLRIGLTWRGQPMHNEDTHRTIPLPVLYPLLDAFPDINWVAVQREPVAEKEWADAGRRQLQWIGGDLRSFDDTAGWVASCDYVLTVHSATVHLAGALGVPTLLLNRAMSDWRWGPVPRIGSTGWYQSVLEVRQRQFGDWTEVMDRVRATVGLLAPAPPREEVPMTVVPRRTRSRA